MAYDAQLLKYAEEVNNFERKREGSWNLWQSFEYLVGDKDSAKSDAFSALQLFLQNNPAVRGYWKRYRRLEVNWRIAELNYRVADRRVFDFLDGAEVMFQKQKAASQIKDFGTATLDGPASMKPVSGSIEAGLYYPKAD